MSLIAAREQLTVWLVDDVPTRVVWQGKRYRVSDTPTRLTETIAEPMVTHPLERVVGWRFQGTPDDGGPSYVFDVAPTNGPHWRLLRLWD